jgi:hypothetical protein
MRKRKKYNPLKEKFVLEIKCVLDTQNIKHEIEQNKTKQNKTK